MSDGHAVPRDLTLTLRLDALRKSFIQIKAMEETVQSRREEIEQLHRHTTGLNIKLQLKRIEQKIRNSKELTEQKDEQSDVDSEILENLQQAAAIMATVTQAVGAVSESVSTMQDRWSEIPVGDLQVVNDALSNKCEQRIQKVEAMQRQLASATDASGIPAEVWKDYEDIAFHDGERCFGGERLFAEYVDFLGGLALRNTGIDRGVCQMADELLRNCSRIAGADLWHSMTVPSRRLPPEATLARMIRMGFPEWTIWAVPLGAYEYGHIVVAENESLRDEIDDAGLAGSLPGIQAYLADIFATYFMGPSYAYASILLALDPCSGGSNGDGGSSPDGLRAHVILSTLTCMDAAVYDGVRGTLESFWEDALHVFDRAFPLADDIAATLDQAVTIMVTFLRDRALHLQYKSAQWEKVTQWSSLLAWENEGEFRLESTDDIRDILNAAWHQRIRNGEACTGLAPDELADAAQALWRTELSAHRRPPGYVGPEGRGR